MSTVLKKCEEFLAGLAGARWFWFMAGAMAVGVYSVLHGIYLNNDIDNAWTTAWIYNFTRYGSTHDVVFCDGDATYWGVRFFSHLFCWLYGGVASVTGFDRNSLQVISIALMVAGFYFWFRIGSTLLEDRRSNAVFMVLLVFSGVAVAAAMKIRVDALVFALSALSFLLMIRARWFLSILVACVAVETHPIGITAFCYLGAYLLACRREVLLDWKRPRALLLMIAGGLCGVALYVGLHHSELASMGAMVQNATRERGNFLYMHFFGRGSLPWRYLPELLLFVAALVAHFIVFRRRKAFFPIAVAMLLACSMLIRRGNFHYALFAYPAFLLLTANVAGRLSRALPALLAVGWLVLMVPQFTFLAIRNQPGRDFNDYVATLKRTGIPEASAVYGMPSDYFAFMDYPGFRTLPLCRKDREAYLIEHSGTIYMQPGFRCDLDYDPLRWSLGKISEFRPRSGGLVTIWKVSARSPKGDIQSKRGDLQ
ncbi:MAG: hypothetical protein WCL44_10935 [bacterium]